jgi:hypothetical protein
MTSTPTWAYEHDLRHVWHDLRRARQRAAAREAAADEHFLQELVHVLRPPDIVSSIMSDHERAVGT